MASPGGRSTRVPHTIVDLFPHCINATPARMKSFGLASSSTYMNTQCIYLKVLQFLMMKKKLYAGLLFALLTMSGISLCNHAHSQTSDTITAINLPLPHEDLSLYDFASVRIETDKTEIPPADITKRNFQRVKEFFQKDEMHFGDSVKSVWIKFQLTNDQSSDTTMALIFAGGVSKAVLYKDESSRLILVGKTGFFLAKLARNVFDQDNRIDIPLKAHSKTNYFIQVILYHGVWIQKMPVLENFTYAETNLFKWEKEVNRLSLLWDHFFMGIFFMFFVFGLIKYLVLGKDRAYLYYSLLGLCLAILTLDQAQYPALELSSFENIRGIEWFDLLSTIAFIMHGLFIIEILQLKIKYPRITRVIQWYFVLKFLLYLIIKIIFFTSRTDSILDYITLYDAILFNLLLLSWVVYMATIRKGFYRFIFLGALTIFLGYTLMFIVAFFGLHYLLPVWFGDDGRASVFHFMAIAYVIDMLFYFTGLAYRDRQVEKDKIIFQEQLIQQLETNKDLQEKFTGELEQQVKEKTAEVVKEKAEVENTLQELRSAQAQLIQSEKMASLGELTAGIAHEIQNPLNFVNNFSEVSNELLDEMKTELLNDNKEDAIAIADDVKQNLEKILHHGKRAEVIVKGMLQHSRTSTGIKEPTDINKLVDEYLRLAYHGMRAKDKSFNATLKTDYDETIGNINIIPQDIGRVFLNLYNNAFYAVAEKKKIPGENYEPLITVSTSLNPPLTSGGRGALISVRDNGPGIPQKVLDKIFQPFFTTKPTGQGTGLGLSLSYDIIKAHGGEIKVETKEGEGAEFIILLPIN